MIYLSKEEKQQDFIFLEELHNYLKKNPQEILRNIKKEFVEVANLDVKLDKWIEKGYIKRENKRYESKLPFYALDNFQQLVEIGKSLAEELQDVSIFEVFQGILLPEILFPIVMEKDTYAKIQTYLWHENKLSSEKFEVIVFENEKPQKTLTRYFQGKNETVALLEIYQILGDVVSDYYLDNTLGKLYRSKDKPLSESRPDIFTTSLEKFGLLNHEKKAQVIFLEDTLIRKEKVAEIAAVFQKQTLELSLLEKHLLRGILLEKLGIHTTTAIKKKKRERRR